MQSEAEDLMYTAVIESATRPDAEEPARWGHWRREPVQSSHSSGLVARNQEMGLAGPRSASGDRGTSGTRMPRFSSDWGVVNTTDPASKRCIVSYAARIACMAAVVALCVGATVGAGSQSPPSAKDQVKFGVKMASRGLWSEALFRFRQAARMDPNNPDILNNMAVAHEALGMFEEALESYRKALAMAPSHKGIRGNYSRFVEFYQSFKPPEEEEAREEEAETEVDDGETGVDSGEATETGDRARGQR